MILYSDYNHNSICLRDFYSHSIMGKWRHKNFYWYYDINGTSVRKDTFSSYAYDYDNNIYWL